MDCYSIIKSLLELAKKTQQTRSRNLDVVLRLAEIKHLECLLGSLNTAEGHGSEGRA